jgi:glycosyltransferase involved in cell wall biosynthesis
MTRRIVGIALVRNEENFVTWSLSNVAGFCDELLIVDNQSDDGTPQRIESLRARIPGVQVHRVEDPNRSHRLIEKYAGEQVWVMGVDGDEIYDPDGLARLRSRILSGELDAWWAVEGHSLHATRFDFGADLVRGFSTPASYSVTKLYNFGALTSWHEPERERLHGNRMEFRPGWSHDRVLRLARTEAWATCDLRLLHLCFFPRSSEGPSDPLRRPNPAEVRAGPLGRVHHWIKNRLRNPLSRQASYKVRRYRKGTVVERELGGFGRPLDWAAEDPRASETERVLSEPSPVDRRDPHTR